MIKNSKKIKKNNKQTNFDKPNIYMAENLNEIKLNIRKNNDKDEEVEVFSISFIIAFFLNTSI